MQYDTQYHTSSSSRTESNHEAEVRLTLDAFAHAVRSGEIEDIMAFYADELIAFDMMPPLRFTSKDAYQRKAWEQCFTEVFRFPVHFTFSAQKILAEDTMATCFGLTHINATSENGERMDNWIRNTMVLRKSGGEWKIVHEHNSVPLEIGTMKGLLDLKPDDEVH